MGVTPQRSLEYTRLRRHKNAQSVFEQPMAGAGVVKRIDALSKNVYISAYIARFLLVLG